jgi:hypothetical protein
MIDLFLFENEAPQAKHAMAHGIRHFLLDWEIVDKAERQKGFDTEIRPGTVDDLCALTAVPGGTTWCRINRYGLQTAREIDAAVAAGAEGLFLPMVTSLSEVEDFLRLVGARCATGIMVETVEAYAMARDLASLPLQRVYFGLNDFAISRGGGSIFRAVLDGSVERMREIFREQAFGFGGMTAIEAGDPLPARLLLEEMARLHCNYTFLRRSFRRDTRACCPGEVVAGIQAAWQRCRKRDAETIRRDRQILETRLHELCR